MQNGKAPLQRLKKHSSNPRVHATTHETDGVVGFELVVFGSQGQGDVSQESDLDVVIVSDDFRGKDIFERAAMTKDLEIETIRNFMIPLDVLTMTPDEFENENSLLAGYAREGLVIAD